MKRRNGFTIIELLVVIAIIGILAAIIFPVYAQAKKTAYRSSDISNMNSLRTALQLYKADSGAYPPSLLGYVNQYENVDIGGNIVPPNALRAALYPKRVESLANFRPALNRMSENPPTEAYNASTIEAGNSAMVAPAVWPQGVLFASTSDRRSQRFGPTDGFVKHAVVTSGGCAVENSYYYRVSGYDAAQVEGLGGRRYETHYQLFWTAWTVPANPCSPDDATENGSAVDEKRQLGYSEPPDDTVVTWNSYFRDYNAGSPQHQKQDLVLFLGGSARPVDSLNVATQAWAVKP